MNHRYRSILMWALYALLFLLVLLVQTVVLGRVRVLGARLSLMPVLMVCVGLCTGHEAGGLYGLAAALVWSCAGADDGPVAILSFTIFGILAGYLGSSVFARHFVPALFLSLGALLLHEGSVFLLRFYLEHAEPALSLRVLVSAGLSFLAVPPIYGLTKLIRKAGGN